MPTKMKPTASDMESIFKNLDLKYKICWWKKFLLFFRPKIYSYDIARGNGVVVVAKELFGVFYIQNMEVSK